MVGCQEISKRSPPYMGRHLQALLHDGMKKRLGHGFGERALLKLEHEGRVDRVRDSRHRRIPEVQEAGVAPRGGERAHEHQPEGALGIIDREALRDVAAHGMAGDHGRPKPERVHERREVCREIVRTVARCRAIGVAVTPLRQGKAVNGLGQMRQDGLERSPGIGVAVEKQHGNARRISLLHIGELDPIRKFQLGHGHLAVGKLHKRVRRAHR
jgi:hypothetical protein